MAGKRYWYLTKKTKEPRVFTQLPNGYDIFVGEVIIPQDDGTFNHILFDRDSSNVIKRFNDKGLDFDGSRNVITNLLLSMEPKPKAVNLNRKKL